MAHLGTLHSFVLDCPDPRGLAEFYRGLLGGTIHPDGEDWVNLRIDGNRAKLAFQQSPGYVAPAWPSDDGDQQAHLDIEVPDLAGAHDEVLALGARHVESHDTFRVYLDPVGHPFCTVV